MATKQHGTSCGLKKTKSNGLIIFCPISADQHLRPVPHLQSLGITIATRGIGIISNQRAPGEPPDFLRKHKRRNGNIQSPKMAHVTPFNVPGVLLISLKQDNISNINKHAK